MFSFLGKPIFTEKENRLITWELNSLCPYKCSYCITNWHGNQSNCNTDPLFSYHNDFSIETVNKFLDLNFSRFNLHHTICSRGESTNSNYFKDFINMLCKKENTKDVFLISNIYKPISWWKNTLSEFKEEELLKLRLFCSYHHEMTTNKEFSDKILYLKSLVKQVKIGLVCTKSNIKEILKIMKEFSGIALLGITFDGRGFGNSKLELSEEEKNLATFEMHNVNSIYQMLDKEDIDENLYSILQDDVQIMTLKEFQEARTRGMLCGNGFQVFNVILNNGNVYNSVGNRKCPNKRKLLGNVFENPKIIIDKPMLCLEKCCDDVCSTPTVPKYSVGFYREFLQ